MSNSTITVPTIDLSLLTSRLVNVASSLQGVANVVEAIAKTPQVANADAPSWARELMDNTAKILHENQQLRQDNEYLKAAMSQILDETKAITKANQWLVADSNNLLSGYARIMTRIDEITVSLTKLEKATSRPKHKDETLTQQAHARQTEGVAAFRLPVTTNTSAQPLISPLRETPASVGYISQEG